MKKIFISIIFLLISNFIFSQDTSSTKFTYCELVGYSKLFSTKVTISIDYGEEKGFFRDNRLRDEVSGKVQSFNSMVDALNYMGKEGWEFVQAYIVTVGNSSVYHWLLKRKT